MFSASILPVIVLTPALSASLNLTLVPAPSACSAMFLSTPALVALKLTFEPITSILP